jgi:hypothetical protein
MEIKSPKFHLKWGNTSYASPSDKIQCLNRNNMKSKIINLQGNY